MTTKSPTPLTDAESSDHVIVSRSLKEMLKSKVTTKLHGRHLYSVETIAEIAQEATHSLELKLQEAERQRDEAGKDTERLDWLEKARPQLNCVMGAPGNYHYSIGSHDGFPSYRQAIDAAMNQTKND